MTMDRTMISRLSPGKVGGWLLMASAILMFNGCVLTAQSNSKAYRFPANAASQIRQHIQCKGIMLMIPVVLANWPRENKVAVLENPVEIAFPFDALPSFTG